jgi:hypothetical protein
MPISGSVMEAWASNFFSGQDSSQNFCQLAVVDLQQPSLHQPFYEIGQIFFQSCRVNLELRQQQIIGILEGLGLRDGLPHLGPHVIQAMVIFAVQIKEYRLVLKNPDQEMFRYRNF